MTKNRKRAQQWQERTWETLSILQLQKSRNSLAVTAFQSLRFAWFKRKTKSFLCSYTRIKLTPLFHPKHLPLPLFSSQNELAVLTSGTACLAARCPVCDEYSRCTVSPRAHLHVVWMLWFMFLTETNRACPLLFILFSCLVLSLWPFQLCFIP